MVTLDCEMTRADGVTLVMATLSTAEGHTRVTVQNRLDGPVWPPRCRGVPAAGWDGDTFECVVAANETQAVGYATPAEPTGEPLTVTDAEPLSRESDGEFSPRVPVPSVDPDPAAVVRTLGSPRPPRDAVGVAPGAESESERTAAGDERSGAASVASDERQRNCPTGDGLEPTRATVTDWLDEAASRAGVAGGGGPKRETGTCEGPRDAAPARGQPGDPASRLAADADRLRRVAGHAAALADRAATAAGRDDRVR